MERKKTNLNKIIQKDKSDKESKNLNTDLEIHTTEPSVKPQSSNRKTKKKTPKGGKTDDKREAGKIQRTKVYTGKKRKNQERRREKNRREPSAIPPRKREGFYPWDF